MALDAFPSTSSGRCSATLWVTSQLKLLPCNLQVAPGQRTFKRDHFACDIAEKCKTWSLLLTTSLTCSHILRHLFTLSVLRLHHHSHDLHRARPLYALRVSRLCRKGQAVTMQDVSGRQRLVKRQGAIAAVCPRDQFDLVKN